MSLKVFLKRELTYFRVIISFSPNPKVILQFVSIYVIHQVQLIALNDELRHIL